MSSAAEPRLTGGIIASVLLHGGLVAAFLLMRSPAPPPAPPMIRISMIAAPAGPRAPGVVQETPAPTVPEPPKPEPVAAPSKPRPTAPTTKPKATAQKAATQLAPPKSTDAKPPAKAPAAGGGPVGGKGSDVATIDTPGIEFDYPYYSRNIVTRLLQYFGNFTGSLRAEVRFTIKRDGSVDPATIRLVTPSGNYTFDQRALGAVEAAANARAFGALPGGFREDILPVTFWFSPQVIR